jgi:phage terminase small subunit
MPARSLSDKEKRDNKIKKQVSKFMDSVRAFLTNKSGGVAPEWECSLMLLETYYKQFLEMCDEIDELDSLIVQSRYGSVPHPLLNARDKAAIRLESMMKQLGITFKEAARMELVQPEIEESDLEKWIKAKNNGVEKR